MAVADAFGYDLETMEDLTLTAVDSVLGPRREGGAAEPLPHRLRPPPGRGGPARPGVTRPGYRPDAPEWLFELFNPWTTPAALVVAVTAVGGLIGLHGRHLAALAASPPPASGSGRAGRSAPPGGLLDLQIFVGAGRDWLHDTSLYDYHDRVHNLGATYPPIGPIFFALLVPMSAECREILWTAMSLAALAGATWFTAEIAGSSGISRSTWRRAFAATGRDLPVWSRCARAG